MSIINHVVRNEEKILIFYLYFIIILLIYKALRLLEINVIIYIVKLLAEN